MTAKNRTSEYSIRETTEHRILYQEEQQDDKNVLNYSMTDRDNHPDHYKIRFQDALSKLNPEAAEALNHRADLLSEHRDRHDEYTEAVKESFARVNFPNMKTMQENADHIARSIYEPTHENLDLMENELSLKEPNLDNPIYQESNYDPAAYIEQREGMLAQFASARDALIEKAQGFAEELCQKGAEFMSSAADNIADFAGNLPGTAADVAGSVAETAGEYTSNAAELAGNVIENAAPAT